MSADTADNRPVLRDDRLPVVVAGVAPEHERALAEKHPRWFSLTSQRQARGLALGPDGHLWLATGGGIVRWGHEMQRYTRFGSEHGLPGNPTADVVVDATGQVWTIGGTSQLHFLHGDSWLLYDHLRNISCLSIDNAGQLWAAGTDGVWAINHAQEAPTPLPYINDGSLAISAPRVLAVTDDRDVWVANAHGIWHYDGANWEVRSDIPSVLTLLRQGDSLWLGTMEGLFQIDLEKAYAPNRRWPGGAVTALAAAADGVWVAMDHKVGLVDGMEWRPMPGQVGAPITGLADAGGGEVWIATHDGLLRGGPNGMRHHETGAPPDIISAIGAGGGHDPFCNMVQALAAQRERGRFVLWIGTARGLFRLDPENHVWRVLTRPRLRDVRALVSGGTEGGLWAASWDVGLQRLPGRIVSPGVPHAIVFLASGPASEHWAVACLEAKPDWEQATARPDGVYRRADGTWSLALAGSKVRKAGMPAGARVQTVAPARNDRLWIGTSAGLWHWDKSKHALEGPDKVVGNAEVRTLLALPPQLDLLCVGSAQGLFSGRSGDLSPVAGLEDHVITALAWDSDTNHLWVGTTAGLVQLRRVDDGWQLAQPQFTTVNSGLTADYITALTLISDRADETQVWIGTPCGLTCYYDSHEEEIAT